MLVRSSAEGATQPTPLNKILRASALLLFLFGALFTSPAHSARFDGCNVKPTSPLVVNVKDKGAKGDGRTEDTKAIQKAIDEVAGTGGTVYVPPGTYMVRATGSKTLALRSKMTLKLADGATLKVIPNAEPRYYTLKIHDASDVAVVGGTLLGDRRDHKGKKGEWGMGIDIARGSKRVTIAGVTAMKMWGDAFYVKDASDVAFCSVSALNNRRQGLSIVSADRVLVTNSEFRATRGTRPSAGIDLEPNKPNERITNVRIEHSKFIDNAGGGIMISGKKGEVANIAILHNYFEGSRPILVENAPKVGSTSICENRFVRKETAANQGFNTFADAVEVVSLQTDCRKGSDMRFEKNRQTKRKH